MVPLGGCVHATPLFEVLHHSLPGLPVVVATHGIGLQVVQHNPHVSHLIETPDVLTNLPAAGRVLRSTLRTHGLVPAWVINDLSNRRSRIALLNTIYIRRPLLGFNLAHGLQQITLQRDTKLSMIANNLTIASALGASAQHCEPRVFVSASAVDRARTLHREINPEAKPTVVFSTQASGGQPSEWHPDRVQVVAAAAHARGLLPVFVGTVHQSNAIDRLRHLSGVPTASIAGRTDIPTLSSFLALADLCISIDTGTMHVARASGLPLIVLAPTYQSPIEWLPLGLHFARVLRGPGTAPVQPSYKLDEIQPAEVISAMDDLLYLYPPSQQVREARLATILTDVDHLATRNNLPTSPVRSPAATNQKTPES